MDFILVCYSINSLAPKIPDRTNVKSLPICMGNFKFRVPLNPVVVALALQQAHEKDKILIKI